MLSPMSASGRSGIADGMGDPARAVEVDDPDLVGLELAVDLAHVPAGGGDEAGQFYCAWIVHSAHDGTGLGRNEADALLCSS